MSLLLTQIEFQLRRVWISGFFVADPLISQDGWVTLNRLME